MRKILFHAGLTPLDQPSMRQVFEKSLFTSNTGNLLFQFGMFRTLQTGDCRIDAAFFKDYFSAPMATIDRLNTEYESYVMPMANNFRISYNLKPVTALIRQLKIPVIVAGIELQAKDAELIGQAFPFDQDVKDFCAAVLDHSAIIGVRGEMTADYLSRLGFIPEKHFTVIGCPSMYSCGLNLPRPRMLSLTAQSRVNLCYRIDQPAHMADLFSRLTDTWQNHSIVVQRREELFMLRYGRPVVYTYPEANRCASLYPHDITHPDIREGRMVGFASVHSWLNFMRHVDLNMGSRIHGNISAVLSGTPTLCFTLDTRMEELCRYHNIPYIPAAQLDANARPEQLLEGVDFGRIHNGHEARFRHFVDFLNQNGLKHIYSDTLAPEEIPMDRMLQSLPEWGEVKYHAPLSLSERLEGMYLVNQMRLRKLKKRLLKR